MARVLAAYLNRVVIQGQVCKQVVNFIVCYPGDGSSGPHCLSLDNYCIDDNDSPIHAWLVLEPSISRTVEADKCSAAREV